MKGLVISVVFPFLAMAAWTAKMMAQVHFGKEVELKVRGYDPRDLLAGHYLRYQVDFGNEGTCASKGPGVQCVCVEDQKATFVGACEEVPSSCPVFIRGKCTYGRFDTGLNRFYFPENLQNTLRVTPENSTIKVRVDSQGNAIVTDFLVDGIPILDHARQNR